MLARKLGQAELLAIYVFTLSSWMLSVETFSSVLEGSSHGRGYTSAAILSPLYCQCLP